MYTVYSISAPSVFADYKWDDLLLASPIDMVIICLYIGETEIRSEENTMANFKDKQTSIATVQDRAQCLHLPKSPNFSL